MSIPSSSIAFNAVPTCLDSLSTPDLAQAACVSVSLRHNAIDGAVIVFREAMTYFYDFFHRQGNIAESDFFKERQMVQLESNSTLEDVWSRGTEKKNGIISILMALDESKLQELQQSFVGKRLPIGLEDVFQVVEAKKVELAARTTARVQRNSVIAVIRQRGIAIPGHDLNQENGSFHRVELNSGRNRRCITPQSEAAAYRR